MKRSIILAVALVLMLGANSMATETRTLTMGDNNMVLLDDANIFIFPSRVNEYPNLAVGEFSGNDFNKFGIHWKFGDDNPWVWATYISTESATLPMDLRGGSLVPWDGIWGGGAGTLPPNHRIQSIYGREIGGHKFGFGLNWMRSGHNDDYSNEQSQESYNSFGIMFGLTEMTGLWDVVLDVNLGSWTDEDADGKKETESDGYLDFGLAGRYFKSGPSYTWIPHFGFMYSKRGIKNNVMVTGPDTLDLTIKDTRLGVEIGMGLNWEPAKNVLAVADFGVNYEKTKRTYDTTTYTAGTVPDEQTWKTFTLPFWKIGMDADVFSWMDVRFGATSDWASVTSESKVSGGGSKMTTSSASNATYLGFGFHWGRLHVDTQANPDLFLDGFNFISGRGNDMNWRISALYEMM